LSVPGNTYIQTLRGFNGYHLEWRLTCDGDLNNYIHYRASYPGASLKKMELKKHDYINSGEHRDLLHMRDVIDAFRAFYFGQGMPAWLEWRKIKI